MITFAQGMNNLLKDLKRKIIQRAGTVSTEEQQQFIVNEASKIVEKRLIKQMKKAHRRFLESIIDEK